jgi:short-subunit dehydrogenase
MTRETAIVIGAGSGLGRSLCQHLAKSGYDLILSSRNERDLTATANDLEIRFGIKTKVLRIDLAKIDAGNYNEYINQCFETSGLIRQVYITAAMMDSHDVGETSIQSLRQMFDSNFFGISFLVSALALRLRDFKSNITVISSIAAIRPRKQNISYSSSKIALEYFVLGLKHHYADSKVNIQIYRMGYMDVPRNQDKKLWFPMVPVAEAADYIYRNREKNFQIRYYPFFWKFVSDILPLLPWSLYKRLNF